jgi:UTP--glucose-1-phosphate uridylyltransferase
MKTIRTAVIPVAGYGTRRLPITKAIEKCMLPIGDRPVVDYVVADCAAAGIEHVIFVVSETAVQLQTYYGHNRNLEKYLLEQGKISELELIKGTSRGMAISYVTQSENGPYGTAVPIQLVASHLMGEEAFVVLMGDAFVYRPDNSSELADAVKVYKSEASAHLMLCAEVPKEEAQHYGLVETNEKNQLTHFLEKPSPENIPSPALANLNQLICDVSILEQLEAYMASQPPQQNKGEYYLTDVLQKAAETGQDVAVRSIQGEYLDAGNTDSWLKANNRILNEKT